MDTQPAHALLRQFIATQIEQLPGPAVAALDRYVQGYVQDEVFSYKATLPLLAYLAAGGRHPERAVPLTAAWLFYLAAADAFDDAQDGRTQTQNAGVAGVGRATASLAHLDADDDTHKDLLDAVGRVITLGANAQHEEAVNGRLRSKQTYFSQVLGKAATIIATGLWLGARLATGDQALLSACKEFGLALGMSIQIGDDCRDLAEDLAGGLYTLPVLEALAADHPQQPLLRQLLDRQPPDPATITQIVALLEEMGSLRFCRYQAEIYKAQAAAVFQAAPGLEQYFADYVTPTH